MSAAEKKPKAVALAQKKADQVATVAQLMAALKARSGGNQAPHSSTMPARRPALSSSVAKVYRDACRVHEGNQCFEYGGLFASARFIPL